MARRGSPAAQSSPRHGAEDLGQFTARLAELRAELAPPTQPGAYEAHTDGACLGNPDGPGGWAAVVEHLGSPDAAPWELWGHLSSTSNNRAEALGLLAALEWVPVGSALNVRSDSELTVKILTGAYRARANLDIWQEIRRAIAEKRLLVQSQWVRGHAGDPGNERADALSVLGAVNGDADRWAQIRSAARPTRAPAAPAVPPPPELAGLTPRNPWQASFLQSVARQLRGGRPLSEKQAAVLQRMRSEQSASSQRRG